MSSESIKRIQKDIKYHSSDINQHGIYVFFDDNNIYVSALIFGPKKPLIKMVYLI